MSAKKEALLLSILFIGFVVLSGSASRKNSITVDEFAHIACGAYYLKTFDFSLYRKSPPLGRFIISLPLVLSKAHIETNLKKFEKSPWLPWEYGTDFMRRNQKNYIELFQMSRAVVLFFGMLLGLVLYFFLRNFYGKKGAIISLVAYCFCPEILAHSGIASLDLISTFFIFISIILTWFWIEKENWVKTVAIGIVIGFGFLVKFSSFLFLPLFIFAWVIKFFIKKTENKIDIKKLGKWLIQNVVFLAIAWFLVCAGYGFKGMFVNFHPEFHSRSFNRLSSIIPGFALFFPEDFILGLDEQMLDNEMGEFPNYFLGEWYRGNKWHYYSVAVLFKFPIPILIGFFLSLFMGKNKRFTDMEWFFLGIIAFAFLVISFGNSLQIGIRYLLPLFPLGIVFLARFQSHLEKKGFLSSVIFFLGLWLLIEVIFSYPSYLSYFNQFGKLWKNKTQKPALLDSNLDWGQDLVLLKEFMNKKGIKEIELVYFGHIDPKFYGINYQIPDEKKLEYRAISAQYYYGYGVYFYPLLYLSPAQMIDFSWVKPYLGRKEEKDSPPSILVFRNR